MDKLVVHLKVDKADRSIGRGATEPCVNLKVITMWRNRFRTEPFHYRLKLAVGLKAIQKTEIAYDVLAGKKETSKVNPDVVERIFNSFDHDRLNRLCKEIGRYKLVEESRIKATQGVKLWVEDWLEKFDKTPARPTATNLPKDKFTSRRLKNDEIFRAGFFELAEEIMLVEYPRFPSA
ncbi:uncharacterized protein LOC100888239 [Strongylocentrotus purpuratus]|uniref:Uncharacterized protein n=1 Tax=Strongylocentrotus purpuratus TaxID=7668 RepID=A0A7M7NDD3_STRPU|nr:uncharacterized protein LOC100888239 [Strongylocentrotus purpuratus]